jgi:hypothetical protein
MSNTITPTVFYRTLNMEGLEPGGSLWLQRERDSRRHFEEYSSPGVADISA